MSKTGTITIGGANQASDRDRPQHTFQRLLVTPAAGAPYLCRTAVLQYLSHIMPSAKVSDGHASVSNVAGVGKVALFRFGRRTIEVVVKQRLVQLGWTDRSTSRRVSLTSFNWGAQFLDDLSATTDFVRSMA